MAGLSIGTEAGTARLQKPFTMEQLGQRVRELLDAGSSRHDVATLQRLLRDHCDGDPNTRGESTTNVIVATSLPSLVTRKVVVSGRASWAPYQRPSLSASA